MTETERKIDKLLNFTIYSTYALFVSFASYFLMGFVSLFVASGKSPEIRKEEHHKFLVPFGRFFLFLTIALFVLICSGILGLWFLEKKLTNNESKVGILKNKLPWNKKTTIFLEICGWLFFVQTIVGIVVAAKDPNDWEHALFYSLQGFVGDRLSERSKQRFQSCRKSWKKELKKITERNNLYQKINQTPINVVIDPQSNRYSNIFSPPFNDNFYPNPYRRF